MLTHIGEKPYQCSECINDVSKNNDLTRHLNAKSEEKHISTLVAAASDKAFTTKVILKAT